MPRAGWGSRNAECGAHLCECRGIVHTSQMQRPTRVVPQGPPARQDQSQDLARALPSTPRLMGGAGGPDGAWGAAGAPLHPSPAAPAPRVKDPMAAGDDCGHIRFFSFSLIEGYISLVMDVQTQQR